MQALQRGVIDLIKACLTQEKAYLGTDFDWAAAYQIGRSHDILPMLYYGIVQSEIQIPAELRDALRLETIKSAMLDQNQSREVEGIERSFQAEGIDYLLLKGAVMKQRYLHAEVRTMGDADILIREGQYERIRPILQELGFTEILESDHELIWDKPGRLHLELHKRPIPSYNKDFYAYYGDGWSLAHRTDSSRHEMHDEDEFIYLFTHYAKHYRDGGVGIRQVADLFVFAQTSPELDYQYIETELRKLRLYDFYKNTMATIAAWFEGGEETAMTDHLTDSIFSSGVFGTDEEHVLSSGVKDAVHVKPEVVKWRRKMRLVFPSAKNLAKMYPILEKCKLVLPFVWVHRWIRVLLFKRQSIRQNFAKADRLTAENIMNHKAKLNYVGLDFNFHAEK